MALLIVEQRSVARRESTVRSHRFTVEVSPFGDEMWRGVVSRGYAAWVMGLSIDQLLDVAWREGLDARLGFHVEDLIRLAAKLSATTRDPERKARLRAAVSTFVAIRDDARDDAA